MLMYLFNKYYRELRSHMLWGMDKTNKNNRNNSTRIQGSVSRTAMVLCIFCTHDATLF